MDLNFSTGAVTYRINSKTEIVFNPTDTNFIDRLYSAFSALEAKEKERVAQAKTLEGAEAFDFCRGIDREMRKTIDGLFGDGVCDGIFGDVSVYAFSNGSPLWLNFMLAIVEQCHEGITAQESAKNPVLEKYLKKYGRKA